MINKLPINDILIRIQAVAKENGVNLTYVGMKVYLKLLEYAEDEMSGAQEEPKGVRFYLTTHAFARYCSVSPRTVTDTLRKLKQCGIIKYTVQTPGPSVIVLYNDFYQ